MTAQTVPQLFQTNAPRLNKKRTQREKTVAKKRPTKLPTPPKHLSAEAKAWWGEICERFELEAQHLKLLQAACESWDRMVQARDILNRDGLTYDDFRGQPKPRPQVNVERDSRIAFQRALRELCLDVEGGPVESRPPRR